MPTNITPPPAPTDPVHKVVQINAVMLPAKALYGLYAALLASLVIIVAQAWLIAVMASKLGL